MSRLVNIYSQFFPGKPKFTEDDITDLTGKVYIVTGTNSGVGKEVAQILYQKNAKVYVAARSEEKAQEAIQAIKESYQQSKGDLVFLRLDLGDLATIKASVNEFLSREKKLHVLFNNAGVMWPPQGSKTAQGYELQLGTNNLGTFLFTKLLTPTLVSTARSESPSTVRVVWVSSSATEMSPKPGGIPMGNLDYHEDQSAQTKYAVSKAGNYLHSTEFAKRYKQDGVVSVALNPGNLETGLQRHVSPFQRWLINLILYPAKYGAYTELFAGISSEVTIDRTGQWIIPWGRFGDLRTDIVEASKSESEGGTGLAKKWWEWTEDQVKPYL